MTKKDILKMETIAYYSGFNGLEIKDIEYGIDDHVLCVSGAWYGKAKAPPLENILHMRKCLHKIKR